MGDRRWHMILKPRHDSEWLENPQVVSILSEGSLSRPELFERLRRVQEVTDTPFGRGGPHSNRTYLRWVRYFEDRGIVEEDGEVLSLTRLGWWVANSKLGTIFQRERFLPLMSCTRCSASQTKVLFKPLIDTRRTNNEEALFMDLQCPKCGDLEKHRNLSPLAKEDGFVGFYNMVIGELRHVISVEASEI